MYTKKQKQIITDFIKKIDTDYEVFFEKVFSADVYEEQVFVGSKAYIKCYDSEMFMNWFSKEFGFTMNKWLIALLHEIGHLETTSEKLQEQRDLLYKALTLLYEDNTLSIEELNERYFNIPCEYAATAWGVEYYLKNKEKCENLIKTLDLV